MADDTGKKWWEREEEVPTIWQACQTDDGQEYYVNTETGETTWNKPEELMTPEEINATGDWVWIPHASEAFVPAKVVKKTKKVTKVETASGNIKGLPTDKCYVVQRSWLNRVVADLTLLDDMSPPLILNNLKKRFEEQSKIYTNIGNILVSINPYVRLPLYTEDIVRKYISQGQRNQQMEPHVFTIAHNAYYGVTAFKARQSVIISGESGAGKTECTKQCLQYLASIAGSVGNIEKRVLQANPILEAFGNAKTLRNDNSSRFGKYIEIYFNEMGNIHSAKISNYLLEKIRVVQPAPDERNFHIFYQLVKAAPAKMKSALGLVNDPMKYTYLQACCDVSTLDDTKEFKEVEEAFEDLKFKTSEKMGLYGIASAVLALGNVVFKGSRGSSATRISSATTKWAEIAAKNLGVDKDLLTKSLCIRKLHIRGQKTTLVELGAVGASDNRNALCKFIYDKMFNWLVKRVNESLALSRGGGTAALYIGILDIFGFEIFEHNSFEQLCINFTNEMLQQHFNNNTFKLEQKIYRSEQIAFEPIVFIDNKPMIDLITRKPHGILPLLDEELIVPEGSDVKFLGKLKDQQRNNKVFRGKSKSKKGFGVQHYAGTVTYDATGFLEKNRDTLTADLVEMLQESNNSFINTLYPPGKKMSAKARKYSLSKQFQQQLKDLMVQLNATSPHYIRCIKPNETKSPLKFVARNCYEQLTYSGVFEAVSIRKQGFPFRLKHQEFATRYKVIKGSKGGDARKLCKNIIKDVGLDPKNVPIGTTRVLYRAAEYRELELLWSIKTKKASIDAMIKKLVAVNVNSLGSDQKKEQHFIALAQAVREADKFRLKTPTANTARKLLERFVEERMDSKTKNMLKQAKRSLDRDMLKEALEICDREGYITKIVRECRELLEKIYDADDALQYALKHQEEEFLSKSCAMCDEFGYKSKLYMEAKALLKNIKKAKNGLKKAVQKLDVKYLAKAIQFCVSINYETKQVKRCRGLAKRLKEAHNGLLKVIKGSKGKGLTVDQIKAATSKCERKEYDGRPYTKCAEYAECRWLLKRAKRIIEASKKAYKECIEEQVRSVVAAAAALHLQGGKELSALASFVRGSRSKPSLKFLKAMLKGALKCDDDLRAVRTTIRIKDAEAESDPSLFPPARCKLLKAPMAWAQEAGIFDGPKPKIAAAFMSFQEKQLHAPLTNAVQMAAKMDKNRMKDLSDRAKNCFDTVQKFMHQRNTSKIPLRLGQLVADTLQEPCLRDEMYLYIIKQTTDNPEDRNSPAANPKVLATVTPGNSAIDRAWELLALMLTVVPPSDGVGDVLNHWIRRMHKVEPKSDDGFEGQRYFCRGLLARIMHYGPSMKVRVDEEEMKPNVVYDKRKYMTGALKGILDKRLQHDEFEPVKYTSSNAWWLDLNKGKTYSKRGSGGGSSARAVEAFGDDSDSDDFGAPAPAPAKKSRKKEKKSKSKRKEKSSKRSKKSSKSSKSKNKMESKREDEDAYMEDPVDDNLFGDDDDDLFGGGGDDDMFGGGGGGGSSSSKKKKKKKKKKKSKASSSGFSSRGGGSGGLFD